MNVYDFDGTIYQGDSSVDFYFFCLKRYPLLCMFLPIQVLGIAAYKLRLIKKEKAKECFFSFLRGVRDIDSCVICFWKQYSNKIAKWYIDRKRKDDVIVSASPEFLLAPVCRELQIELIGSVVDSSNGKFLKPNCFGKEKRRRFQLKYGDSTLIEAFYSDSYTDSPMAEMAEYKFFISGNDILKWENQNEK